MEAQQLLRNPDIYPSEEALKAALGEKVYDVFDTFTRTITGGECGLNLEWRYYNDGKAWLGKAVYKKKTVLWLSVWKGFFKTSFYFTEKHLEAVAALDIPDTIKEKFFNTRQIGRLIPMLIEVDSNDQLKDLLTVTRFKKSLK